MCVRVRFVSRSIARIRFFFVALVFRVWRVRSSPIFVLLVIVSLFVLRGPSEVVGSDALREGGLCRSGLVRRNRFSTLVVLRLSAVRAPHSSVNVPGSYRSFASRSTFFGLTCACGGGSLPVYVRVYVVVLRGLPTCRVDGADHRVYTFRYCRPGVVT